MTTGPNLSEHPWMENPATGARAQLPDIPYWRALGWDPCDGPPPEPDLTRAPQEPEALAEEPGLPAVKTNPAVKPAPTEEGESDR
jgi:hypothetical protein